MSEETARHGSDAVTELQLQYEYTLGCIYKRGRVTRVILQL